ncbi:fimbria/pilus outer membrane usher protein [Pseudoxanthomonas daejeonensis]|uniref:fimbria/pilus outer membrane usher protein n=1 Tax=Pseudoxanthomonas daejeonensis TaxID=266062 RepID=UPI001F543630|nr:fimbria/pilus outer membrane usher protein [Pseudoxanthomonas daejeonensis]UNK56749.1 fimbria/pilus outer membrane usher protein [Pseudoxanthomonas daejeonensis]
MTIRTTRHCRWKILAASVAAACAPCALLAAPAPNPSPAPFFAPGALDLIETGGPDAEAAAGSQELYLEVSLNEFATGRLARFVMIDGRLHASASTLRELGLQWPGSETAGDLVALDDIPGLQARYDASNQILALSAPLEALSGDREHFGIADRTAPKIDPLTRAPGLLFNYDVYAQGDSDYRSISSWNELRLFGVGPGVWSTSLVSRVDSLPGERDIHDTTRLDTSWQLDLQDSMVSVVVGDTYSGGLGWTRTTRIGGVRASTNFALQPYRVTTPLASFAGEAVLPSTVDLFINGVRQSSQEVRPGQFQIDSIPTITGAGQAQMVITDINGQSRVVSFALYNTPYLLQQGLTDWSVEAGKVRRDYGLRSFSYADDPMGSATVRHGLSDSATLEFHAEGTADLQMAGAGGAWLLGDRGGVLDLNVAGSQYDGQSGHQYGAGYQWNSSIFNVGMSTLRRSDEFADVATLEDAILPRRMDSVFMGVNWGVAQIGASYVRQEMAGQTPARYASLHWSRQLPHNGYLSLSVNRDLENRDSDSAFLYWSMPLDRRVSVSASLRHSRDSDNLTLEANRPVDSDLGGLGWRAQTTLGERPGAQGQISGLGRFGGWNAGLLYMRGDGGAPDTTSGFAGATGSVLFMEKHLFAMRRVEDAFALVTTDGIANVPILQENRLIGYTNEDGLLLVNRLNSWQNNRLSIDPLKTPTDVRMDRTEMYAVPESRSGMLARFPMRSVLSIQATVTAPDGRPIAAGSPVWLQDADPDTSPALTVVGYDGLIYLQELPPGAGLKIRQNGAYCDVVLPELPKPSGFVELDGVVCR